MDFNVLLWLLVADCLCSFFFLDSSPRSLPTSVYNFYCSLLYAHKHHKIHATTNNEPHKMKRENQISIMTHEVFIAWANAEAHAVMKIGMCKNLFANTYTHTHTLEIVTK